MRAVRRYQQGGEFRSLLERLAAQSSPRRPETVASPTMAPNYLGESNFDQVSRIVDAIESGEDIVYDPSLSPAIAEERRFRNLVRQEAQTASADTGEIQFPMESGGLRSVSPMKFVSPVGDVEDIVSGLQMAGRGVSQRDLGKVATGAGLSLASGLMAFAPGNASMLRSIADANNNPVLRKMSFQLGSGETDLNQLYKSLDVPNLTDRQRQNVVDDIQQFLDFDSDPMSGLSLSAGETDALQKMQTAITKVEEPISTTATRFVKEQKDLPKNIGDFELEESILNENSRLIEYRNEKTGDYIDITSTPLTEVDPSLRVAYDVLRDPNFNKKYGDKYINQMNFVLSDLKKTGNRNVAELMNTVFGEVKSGDIINPGSLSTDSYDLYLKQLRKGNRYLKKGGKKQGVRLLEGVDKDVSIEYQALNKLGEFNNTFNIPDDEWSDVLADELLTSTGTSKAGTSAETMFNSLDEANKYLREIKFNKIDPKLKELGLPPTVIEGVPGKEGAIRLQFPVPFTEKLRRGGKLKVKKKRKKGMIAKRR